MNDQDPRAAGGTRILPPRSSDVTRPDTPRTVAEPGPPPAPLTAAVRSNAYPAFPARALRLAQVARGRYQIQRELARGGLGRILEARDQRLDRPVAIKELHFKHPAAHARFAREIAVTARLQHPGIIQVLDAGVLPDGEPYYAMKLVQGQSMAQVIKEKTTLPERLGLLPSVIDAAEAIAYAHDQGFIHRDLKPANILIGPFGETVVIDWGLAKELAVPEPYLPDLPKIAAPPPSDGVITMAGSVVGTPAYMPPEQALGHDVDATADVYALGALLYHLVVGHMPYADEGPVDLAKRVAEGPPTALAKLVPELPGDLVAIIERAMQPHSERRYPNAGEMVRELHAFATGRLVTTYQYSGWELGHRFVRRNKAAVTTGVCAALALAIFGGVSVQKITEERDNAHEARAAAEERANEVAVQRVEALLDNDPTAAVAQLKQLDVMLPGAVRIAASAEEAGVAERILRGHRDQIEAVAFSPDGHHLATGGDDELVFLWDPEPMRLGGHTQRVTAVAFAPDGHDMYSASYDGSVRAWDVQSGTSRVLDGGGGKPQYRQLAVSLDGRRLAAVGVDGGLRVWDDLQAPARPVAVVTDRSLFVGFSPDGTRLLSGSHGGMVRVEGPQKDQVVWLKDHGGEVRAAAFAPDGQSIATVAADGVARVFGLDGTLLRSWRHTGALNALAWAPDGRLACAGDEGLVFLLDAAGRNADTLAGHTEAVLVLAFSPDGRYLASAGWDEAVILHDLLHGTERRLIGHGSRVTGLGFSPDGARLASASWDKTVRVWRVGGSTLAQRVLASRHEDGAESVAFSPDGQFVMSGGHDGTARLWSAQTLRSNVALRQHAGVDRVRFSPDGKWIATAGGDGAIWLLDRQHGGRRRLRGLRAAPVQLTFSPDSRWLAAATADDSTWVWRVQSGKGARLGEVEHINDLAFSPDSKTLALAGRAPPVQVWSLERHRQVQTLAGHADEVRAVAYSADGLLLATASDDDSVRLWHLDSGRSQAVTGLDGARLVAFAPDGHRLAVAGGSRLWLCDLTAVSGAPTSEPEGDAPPIPCSEQRGHRGLINDVQFTPDGRLLTTAGDDGWILVWDVATLEYRRLEAHTRPVFDIDISPDGSRIASASADGTVRLHPARGPPAPKDLRAFLDGLTEEEEAE